MCFVSCVPLSFISLQLLGSELMMLLRVAGPFVRASTIRGMYEVWGGLCIMDVVVSDSLGGWG